MRSGSPSRPGIDARVGAALNDGAEVAFDRHRATAAVLRVLRPEAGEVLEVIRQRGHESLKIRALEEALAGVVLGQAPRESLSQR